MQPSVQIEMLPPIPPDTSLGTSPMSLLEYAVRNGSAIDVIERLAALQRDERNYQANVSFDEALNRCQAAIPPVKANKQNLQTNSWWASYEALDKVVRPIYTAEGFSVSYGERDCPTPGKTRFVAFLSRGGVTREILKDMTPSTEGPKGGNVMTPIHADGATDSYAKRYLLKDIFNIAIGEHDTDGNPKRSSTNPVPNKAFANGIPVNVITERCKAIWRAADLSTLRRVYEQAYNEAQAAKDQTAQAAYIRAKDGRKRELR